MFSTVPGWYLLAHDQFGAGFYGSSSPNILDHGPLVYPHGNVPLYVDFTSPVNNLRFYILAVDDNRPAIAQLNIFQNKLQTTTLNVPGFGNAFAPVSVNLASYNNITRIEVLNITDRNGIGYDDFTFTIAPPPSPTPTPIPSPSATPPTPTNVKGTPDEEEISVSWTPSSGAGWYTVERAESVPQSANVAATESLNFAPIDPVFYCSTSPCVFKDNDSGAGLSTEKLYSYVVSASNAAGSSARSTPSDPVEPLPKPGCDASLKSPTQAEGSRTRHGWLMNYRFSGDSGLELSNISLNGRLMAEWMSAPYFEITAYNSADPNQYPRTRGQLYLNGANPDGSLHSTLTRYQINPEDSYKLLMEATYKIDHIPGAPKACLTDSGRANRVERHHAHDSVRW